MGNLLPSEDVSDLKFSLGTSYALQGEDIDAAVKVLKDCAETCPSENRGFILNNLGMSYFYKFVSLSSKISDPTGEGMEAIKPVIENFDLAHTNLKKSVRDLEMFDTRFGSIDASASS